MIRSLDSRLACPYRFIVNNVGLITKLVLGAFIANASLCPCASVSADTAPEDATVATNTPGMGMHQAHGEGHQPVQADDGAAEHLQATCHTDSALEECGMAAGLDLDARSLEAERVDHLLALIDIRADAVRSPEPPGSAPAPRPPDRQATDTPISSHDRLLI